MTRYAWPFVVLSAALLGAACGAESGTATSGGGGGEGTSVAIEAPAEGAEVSMPFTVRLSSSEPLGPTDTGKHHVHLTFDGSDEYKVVESSTFEVTGLDSGEHSVEASLRNADHSPAGATDEITVTVKGGGGGGDGGGGGGGYDY
jgi:hypothetical protein